MKNGFTLIEVLLSIAIVSVLGAMSVPIYQSLQTRNNLDIAATTLAQALRRTQVLSQAVDGDSNWGVVVQEGNITLFKGASFATRDLDFDEVFEVSPSITIAGISEFTFEKLTGKPQVSGSTTLTSSLNETRTVTINGEGTINY
jgi:prepilin-type N-terminal cleavage/methylation domain-containing protein